MLNIARSYEYSHFLSKPCRSALILIRDWVPRSDLQPLVERQSF